MKDKNLKFTKHVTALFIIVFSYCAYSGPVENAMHDDMQGLCNDRNANELFKIANKKKNSDADRREALALMVEVSKECNNVSTNRLRQYHQKIITAAHKILDLPEMESRKEAIECMQYVILLPEDQKPSQGSISRGQTLANVALNDNDENIRLWALEALVYLRGDDSVVQNTLAAASNDSSSIVSETAEEMLNDMF